MTEACWNNSHVVGLLAVGAAGGVIFYEMFLVPTLDLIVDFFLDRVNWKWRMRR